MSMASRSPVLSVVLPVWNEEGSVVRVVARVSHAPLGDKEIIVVDDCSTDRTSD